MIIKEIANLAGVSISTVSKIVNNKSENINGETRNRVLKIVKEYNYAPYGTAKNASTEQTFLIGVLLNILFRIIFCLMALWQQHKGMAIPL